MNPIKMTFTTASKLTLPNGAAIPHIHLGVYMMTSREAERSVTAALANGYRGIDSAQWYANEAACGAAIGRSGIPRSEIFYTTKLQTNTSYDATRAAIKTSLKKSGMDYIDLYLLHSPYGGPQKRAECWRAVEDAVLEGEVKSAGVSNFGVKHIKELLDRGVRVKPVVNQIEVHPFNQNREIVEYCKEQGIVIEAYAPLVRGMRMRHPVLREVAKKYGVTPAQVLVRWGLQMGFVVLPKSTKEQRIKENADVAGFEIGEEDMKKLAELDEGLVTDWDPTDAA
ncbi:NADP-dependent oxidoreductase domain-containing protein [Pyronema domesticum]|nr:NADP-dependent oxidoreductase domain-containing protein [Pyronema domesticum]